ncbi:MAG TPA: hypothetical protein VHF89_05485 [Solirubrobacteraceae bacterium]|nr:hypothetical protein [Solirubrobacteraceae bacterium]
MRGRIGLAALAATCAAGLAGPATAMAECNTLVTCAVETAEQKAAELQALVDQKVAEAKALVDRTVADATARANAGVHDCVIQARIKPDGTGTGVADCVSRYANNPTGPQKVHSDSVVIKGARVLQTPTGPQVTFAGATNPIGFPTDNGTYYAVARLDDRAGAAGLSVHTGEWVGAGPAYTAVAAFHTVSGAAFGAPGDHFVNGVLVLEGAV